MTKTAKANPANEDVRAQRSIPSDISFANLVPGDAINVRKTGREDGIAELAEGILHSGILVPLNVRELEGGKYQVIDGNRRYTALSKLVEDKRIMKEYPVPVRIMFGIDDTAARQMGLQANLLRKDMSVTDEIRAFKSLVDDGLSITEVALKFGAGETRVRQRVALASVSPLVLAMFEEGKLDLEQLKAFSSTDDHERQDAYLKERATSWMPNAHTIRQAMIGKTLSADNWAILYLGGVDALGDAGLSATEDLFTQELVVDNDKLFDMVREKMRAELVPQLQEQGWKWVSLLDDMEGVEEVWSLSRLRKDKREPTDSEAKEIARLEARDDEILQEISDKEAHLEELEDAEETEAVLDQIDDLQTAIHDLYTQRRENSSQLNNVLDCLEFYSDDTKAKTGCVINFSHNSYTIHEACVHPDDAESAPGKPKPGSTGNDDTDDGKSAPAASDGLTKAASEDFSEILTAAVQVELSERPNFALAVLLSHLVDRLSYSTNTGDYSPLVLGGEVFSADVPAASEIQGKLRETFAEIKPAGSFMERATAFMAMDKRERDQLMGLVIAQFACITDKRANNQLYTAPSRLHALAHTIPGFDLSRHWVPSAEDCNRLSKDAIRQGLLECGVPEDQVTKQMKGKKADSAAYLAECAAKAKWVPGNFRNKPSETD